MLTLEKFEEASETVKKVTQDTKLVYSDYFSAQTGNKVYLKPENMQVTGAYKLRGAYYKISTLSEEERAKGLITASAGNHAQGVAYAAKAFGAKAVIVMPTTTPLIKVERTKSYGAEVVLYGNVYDEACEYAYKMAEEHGYTFIHPFDDPAVATGQGTIAMEIIKELPLVDYILVPIGGGGLATGVSTLVKLLNPNIKVIGVEPAGANCMQASLKEGEVVTLDGVNTIADGTAVKRPGDHIFPYIQKNVDEDKENFMNGRNKADGTNELEERLNQYIVSERNKAVCDLADEEQISAEVLNLYIKEYDYLQKEQPEIIQKALKEKHLGLIKTRKALTRIMERLRNIIRNFNWE